MFDIRRLREINVEIKSLEAEKGSYNKSNAYYRMAYYATEVLEIALKLAKKLEEESNEQKQKISI